MIKWRVYKSFIILRKTITQRLAYNGPNTWASFAPYSTGSIMLCTKPFFLPRYRTFVCVHTLHPSACLCPLTYISSLAFVIFSSLVAKAPWMMSIIPFHIMWRHFSWQSSHCWGHCLVSLSKLTIDFKRTPVSLKENLYNMDYKLRIFHYQHFFFQIWDEAGPMKFLLSPYVVRWQLSLCVSSC